MTNLIKIKKNWLKNWKKCKINTTILFQSHETKKKNQKSNWLKVNSYLKKKLKNLKKLFQGLRDRLKVCNKILNNSIQPLQI